MKPKKITQEGLMLFHLNERECRQIMTIVHIILAQENDKKKNIKALKYLVTREMRSRKLQKTKKFLKPKTVIVIHSINGTTLPQRVGEKNNEKK